MKIIKSGSLFMTALAAIIGAYSMKPSHYGGTTYYAISDGSGGFYWTKVQPNPFLYYCDSGGAYCTIVTRGGYIPQNNIVPNSTQATPTISWHMQYRLMY